MFAALWWLNWVKTSNHNIHNQKYETKTERDDTLGRYCNFYCDTEYPETKIQSCVKEET